MPKHNGNIPKEWGYLDKKLYPYLGDHTNEWEYDSLEMQEKALNSIEYLESQIEGILSERDEFWDSLTWQQVKNYGRQLEDYEIELRYAKETFREATRRLKEWDSNKVRGFENDPDVKKIKGCIWGVIGVVFVITVAPVLSKWVILPILNLF